MISTRLLYFVGVSIEKCIGVGYLIKRRLWGYSMILLRITPLTVDYLKGLGFPEDIVAAIGSLTRLDGENYNDYIERVSKNPLARKVKINDLKDNLDVTRFKSLDESNLPLINR